MNTPELQGVMEWLKTTDLVEVSYHEGAGGAGFSVATSEAASPSGDRFPSRFIAVTAQAVGLFQASPLGKAKPAEEGRSVAEGDVLGFIDGGGPKAKPVVAPAAGRLARVFVEPGDPVQYGQPLFFLEPRS